nr:PLxRFG domain-containing protein [Desulfobacterales bacterium]
AGNNKTTAGVAKGIVAGGFTEGAFEELPQSMQEQIWLNAALGKPLTEGVPEAGATGMLTGMAMGAGGGGVAAISPDTQTLSDENLSAIQEHFGDAGITLAQKSPRAAKRMLNKVGAAAEPQPTTEQPQQQEEVFAGQLADLSDRLQKSTDIEADLNTAVGLHSQLEGDPESQEALDIAILDGLSQGVADGTIKSDILAEIKASVPGENPLSGILGALDLPPVTYAKPEQPGVVEPERIIPTQPVTQADEEKEIFPKITLAERQQKRISAMQKKQPSEVVGEYFPEGTTALLPEIEALLAEKKTIAKADQERIAELSKGQLTVPLDIDIKMSKPEDKYIIEGAYDLVDQATEKLGGKVAMQIVDKNGLPVTPADIREVPIAGERTLGQIEKEIKDRWAQAKTLPAGSKKKSQIANEISALNAEMERAMLAGDKEERGVRVAPERGRVEKAEVVETVEKEVEPIKEKEPWVTPLDKYVKQYIKEQRAAGIPERFFTDEYENGISRDHFASVSKAYSQNKNVPDEVMADYPELIVEEPKPVKKEPAVKPKIIEPVKIKPVIPKPKKLEPVIPEPTPPTKPKKETHAYIFRGKTQEVQKDAVGKAFIKQKQRPIFSQRLIKSGKNKGRYQILFPSGKVNPDGAKIARSAIVDADAIVKVVGTEEVEVEPIIEKPKATPVKKKEVERVREPEKDQVKDIEITGKGKEKTVKVDIPQTKAGELSPKEQKKYLLDEVDVAIGEAKVFEVNDSIQISPNKNLENLSQKQKEEYNKQLRRDKEHNEAMRDKYGTVTIEVPNDGSFTIINEKSVLRTFKKKAKSFPAAMLRQKKAPKVTRKRTFRQIKRIKGFAGEYKHEYKPFYHKLVETDDAGRQWYDGEFFFTGKYVVKIKKKDLPALKEFTVYDKESTPDIRDTFEAVEKDAVSIDKTEVVFISPDGEATDKPMLKVEFRGETSFFNIYQVDAITTLHPDAKMRIKSDGMMLLFEGKKGDTVGLVTAFAGVEGYEISMEAKPTKDDVQFQTAKEPKATTKPLTNEAIEKTFGKMKNVRTGQNSQGNFWFKFKNAPRMTILEVDSINNRLRLDTKKYKKEKTGAFLPKTKQIWFKTGGVGEKADIGSLHHENWHLYRKMGVVSDRDVKAISRAIKRSGDLGLIGEETMANFVGDAIRDRTYARNTRIGRIIQKIIDFFDGMVNLVTTTSRGVLRKAETGKIVDQDVTIREPGLDLAPAMFQTMAKEFDTTEEQLQKEFEETKAKFENTDKWMKAPNGEPSNLNEHLWVMTQTPRFKKWFGDSKVIDGNGEPLVVYHGTGKKFNIFRSHKINKRGFYFTNKQTLASMFANVAEEGGQVYPVFLRIKNSLNLFYGDVRAGKLSTKQEKEYKEQGYDGISSQIDKNKKVFEYIAFNPNQIKSIYNVGSFDPASEDIRFQTAKEDPVNKPPRQSRKELKEIVADIGKTRIGRRFSSGIIDNEDMKLYQKILHTPYVLAKKFPGMKKALDDEINRHNERAKKMYNYYHGDLNDVQEHMSRNKEDLKSLETLIFDVENTRFSKKNVPTDWYKEEGGKIVIQPKHYDEVQALLEKQGHKQAVIDAFMVLRKTYDQVLAEADSEMRSNNIDPTDLQEFRSYIGKAHNYFPHVREGDSFITIVDTDTGKVVWREHFWKAKEHLLPENKMATTRAHTALKDLLASGELEGDKDKYKIGKPQKLTKIPDEVFFQIPVEQMDQIAQAAGKVVSAKRVERKASKIMKEEGLSKKEAHKKAYNILQADMGRAIAEAMSDVLKSRGWGAHAIQRKNIPGYKKTDIFQTTFQYLSGFSGFTSKMNVVGKHHKTLHDIDAKKRPEEFKYTSDYIRDNLANSDKVDRTVDNIRAAFFVKYLGGVMKTGIVNLTQNVVMAAPVLSKYTKGSHRKLAKAMKDTRQAVFSKGAWTGKEIDYKSLDGVDKKAMQDLIETGSTQDLFLRELKGSLPGSGWGAIAAKVINKAGIFMQVAEKFNRASTGLAAFRVAYNDGTTFEGEKTKGNYDASLKFAEKIILDSHFLYGKVNMPMAFRGGDIRKIMRAGYTFRSFQHNYFDIMSHMFLHEGWQGKKAVARSLLNIIAVGGLASFPFFKGLSQVLLSALDDDEEDAMTLIRDKMPNAWMKDVVTYGLPGAMFGVDLSGSMGTDLPQKLQDVIGVPYAAWEDTSRMIKSLKAGNIYRAVSETPLTPIVARNAMRGAELFFEGQYTRSGQPINAPGKKGPQKLTAAEAIKKSIGGFQPTKLSKGYAAYSAGTKIRRTLAEQKKAFADRLSNAIKNRDKAKVRKIKRELREWNQAARRDGKPWKVFNIDKMVENRIKSKGLRYYPRAMRPRVKDIYSQWQ